MSEIKEWYSGRNVLVTGGTGFIGKVLVEKLLRTCNLLNCIYIIVRSTESTNFDERKKSYTNHIVFDRIRNSNPKFLEKIKLIKGDMEAKSLGLSNNDYNEIINNVNVVIHTAASVNFSMHLKKAIVTNVSGTFYLLNIAKNIKKLDVFVYVSTAYSQGSQSVTEEIAYPSEIDVCNVMRICEKFDDETLLTLEPKILKTFQNTYGFSKCLSEDLLYRHRNDFPIVVVRPSIVEPSIEDPYPSYIEGYQGYVAFGLAMGRGILRSAVMDPEWKSLTVPVDYVANAIIVSSMLQAKSRKNEINYYNATVSFDKAITIEKSIQFIVEQFRSKCPLNFAIWDINFKMTKCIYYNWICLLLFQLIPAVLLDGLLLIFRQKPILMKVQRKIKWSLDLVRPYQMQKFIFSTDNFNQLKYKLNSIDAEIFKTDLNILNLPEIIKKSAAGVKRYVLKEKLEDLPRAKRNARIFYVLDRVLCAFFIYKILSLILIKLYDYLN